MRIIRTNPAACFLLLTSLPHLLAAAADDSTNLTPDTIDNENTDDVHVRLDLQNEQLEEIIEEEVEGVPLEISEEKDSDLAPIDQAMESADQEDDVIEDQETEEIIDKVQEDIDEQKTEESESEPLVQPEEEDVELVDIEEDVAPSSDNEDDNANKEDEEIIEVDSSTLATDETVAEEIDVIDADSSSDVADEENNDESDKDDNGDDETFERAEELFAEDIEASASQVIQEDGFRLPSLPKIDTTLEELPSDEVTNEETDQGTEPSTEEETEEIETIDDESQVKEDPPIDVSEIVKEIKHEILYEEGHKHIEMSEASKPQVTEDNGADSIDSTDTATAQVAEEEEIIDVEDLKIVVGTTSTEPIKEEEENSDNTEVDGQPIDEELPEENIEDAIEVEDDDSENNNDDTTEPMLENATGEHPVDDADETLVAEPVASVDGTIEPDENGAKVEESVEEEVVEEEIIASNTSEEEKVVEDTRMEPPKEDSADDIGNSEIEIEKDDQVKEIEDEKQEEKPIVDDDEDDEDLAERVSVDYASKSAGALIIEKTAEFKGTSNLITGDRDRYAIVPCSEEKKQVVMSLSEDILVKEIKLANYERFSSTVKDFQVKGSHTLGKWVDLGTFTATSSKGEQTFVLENPAWARYLKFKFLTHHGSEYFCTLSQIKVHGSNMVQDFHEHWESIEEENNEEQVDGDEIEVAAEASKADEVVHSTNTNSNDPTNEKLSGTDLSNSSISHEEDALGHVENKEFDDSEKGDGGPRHAQITPTVHSKPRPLNQFRNHMTFSEIIQVEMGDEKLFTDLYSLIPHTLGNLPAHAKNDMTCVNEDHELRSVHQIGKLAMDSLYRFGSRIVDDFAVSDISTGKVTSSKMDDFSNEFYQKRFGSEISSLVHLYANNIVYPTSPSYIESPENIITDGTSTEIEDSSILSSEVPQATSATKLAIEGSDDSLDFAISKLLKDLPSAECLVHLDFSEFKNKFDTARKSTGSNGNSQGGRMMEPIFKKLTDQIFALQTSLSVHDQFSKLSVSCYQRVILDLALETEKLRRDQDERLRRLEEHMMEPASMRMFQKLVVSVASTTTRWVISNVSSLFFKMTNNWIPRLLRYHLSKDTYNGLKETYATGLGHSQIVGNACSVVLDFLSRGIEAVATAMVSNGWAKPETYQEYLSAWSKYYDGGITVVFIVITLLFCRLIMMCSWILRPSKATGSSSLRPTRNGRTSSSRSSKTYSEDSLYTTLSKKQKKKSSKNKRRPKDPPPDAPSVEDVAATATIKEISEIPEESIPELREEPIAEWSSTPRNNGNANLPTDERDNEPVPAHSPSIVSLDDK